MGWTRYPLFADADTGIYPHLYRKFPYPRQQTRMINNIQYIYYNHIEKNKTKQKRSPIWNERWRPNNWSNVSKMTTMQYQTSPVGTALCISATDVCILVLVQFLILYVWYKETDTIFTRLHPSLPILIDVYVWFVQAMPCETLIIVCNAAIFEREYCLLLLEQIWLLSTIVWETIALFSVKKPHIIYHDNNLS